MDKNRINQTVFRLKMMQRKLEQSQLRNEQKYKKLFSKCIEAQKSKDQALAIMYANECAQIRSIAKTLISSQLVVEQVVLRLEAINKLSDISKEIMISTNIVGVVKGRLMGIIPEVSMQLGFIKHTLDSLTLESIEGSWGQVSYNEESEKIILEATTVAEQKIKEMFPELPNKVE